MLPIICEKLFKGALGESHGNEGLERLNSLRKNSGLFYKMLLQLLQECGEELMATTELKSTAELGH
ncbi:CLL_HP2_G0007930.mRNA.1.CDS.1 [Saccharomyces cerevisiae]|nr:CLL_HP2_G0007930.mRNA.1.CDS.1 [Saccharomyces cerevisiae]CAI6430066.1 CLL_HP2_G0007930.mRNA.1.CDS.1 [Saccharomyces cerevisiae]